MTEVRVNYLCRLCLNESHHYSNIYSSRTTECDPLYEIINYVCDLQISLDDGLPEYVCKQCFCKVQDFEKYKKHTQNATLELLRLKRKVHETPVQIKEEKDGCDSSPEDFSAKDQEGYDRIPADIKREELTVEECRSLPRDGIQSSITSVEFEVIPKKESSSDEVCSRSENGATSGEGDINAEQVPERIAGSVEQFDKGDSFEFHGGIKVKPEVVDLSDDDSCVDDYSSAEKNVAQSDSETVAENLGSVNSSLNACGSLSADFNGAILNARSSMSECVESYRRKKVSGSIRRVVTTQRLHENDMFLNPEGYKIQNESNLLNPRAHANINLDLRGYKHQKYRTFVDSAGFIHTVRNLEDYNYVDQNNSPPVSSQGYNQQYVLGKGTKSDHVSIQTPVPYHPNLIRNDAKVSNGLNEIRVAGGDVISPPSLSVLQMPTGNDGASSPGFNVFQKPLGYPSSANVGGSEKGDVYVCNICEKCFQWRSELKRHLAMHVNDRNHVCGKCDKRFKSHYDQMMHELRHLKQEQRDKENPDKERHSCPTCGKTYVRKRSLKQHMYTHTMPYACPTCGKQFSQSGHLKTHIQTHVGELPHRCEVCGKAYVRKYQLNAHMTSHSDERPFACSVCGMRHKRKYDMRNHELLHLRERNLWRKRSICEAP